jgi:uncharacterized protein YkwD
MRKTYLPRRRAAACLLIPAACLLITACAYRGYELMPTTQRPSETQYPFLGMDLPIAPDEIDVTQWLTVPATQGETPPWEENHTQEGQPSSPYTPQSPGYEAAQATAAPPPAQGARLNKGVGIPPRRIADVYEYLQAHEWSQRTEFAQQPQVSAPYALGKLGDAARRGALNHVNCIRYIAGLPEVAWDDAKTEDAQAAAVILARTKVLTHTPDRPADMPQELYRMAYDACKTSNIANAGRQNTLHNAINMFLDDSDPSNLPELSHRRWMLNPSMGKTAFGLADTYCAMTAVDGSLPRVSAYDVVMYPAQVQPVSFFGAQWAWTVSFAEGFDIGGAVRVILVRRGDSRGWELTPGGRPGVPLGSTYKYGQPKCLIFRPGAFSVAAGDVVDVQIEGVTRGGQAHLVQYTVQFV